MVGLKSVYHSGGRVEVLYVTASLHSSVGAVIFSLSLLSRVQIILSQLHYHNRKDKQNGKYSYATYTRFVDKIAHTTVNGETHTSTLQNGGENPLRTINQKSAQNNAIFFTVVNY